MATKTKLILKIRNQEYWLTYAPEAGVYELFASEANDDYLGVFDNKAQAIAWAKADAAER